MSSIKKLSEVNDRLVRAGLPALTVNDKERLLSRASRAAIVSAVKRVEYDDQARSYLISLLVDCGLISTGELAAVKSEETFSLSAPPSERISGKNSTRYPRERRWNRAGGKQLADCDQVVITDDSAVFCIDALHEPVAGEKGMVVKAAPKSQGDRGQWRCGRSVVLTGEGLLIFAAVWLGAISAEAEVRDACDRNRWLGVRQDQHGSIVLELFGQGGSPHKAIVSARRHFDVGCLCINLFRHGYGALKEDDVCSLLRDYINRKGAQCDPRVRIKNFDWTHAQAGGAGR